MTEELELGFRAFDPHELLCHFLARASGHYKDAGVRVRLVDLTFRPGATLTETTVQASCGAAMFDALGGGPYRIALVAASRPMFWLYARIPRRTLRDLAGERIAGFPDLAPPAHFLRIAAREAGLDPDTELRVEQVRDDTARLGLLLAGEVEACLLSSAMPAPRIAAIGLVPLVCLGDIISAPTTGLAVHHRLAASAPNTVQRLVHAWRAALADLHAGGQETQNVVETVFSFGSDEARWTVKQAQLRMLSAGKLAVADAHDALRRLGLHLGHAQEPQLDSVFLEQALAS